LIAVIIKVWWESIDDIYRELAHFVKLQDSAQPASSSAVLTYANTPIIWVTAKEVANGHWTLALVTSGTFAAEILQILTSALWKREPGAIKQDVQVEEMNEIRNVPHVFLAYQGTRTGSRGLPWPHTRPHLFGGLRYQSSWLFRALMQCVYGVTAPTFSKDGWTFASTNLQRFAQVDTEHDRLFDSNADQSARKNVTFNTPALFGRFECSVIADEGQWVTRKNLKDASQWNISASPADWTNGYEFSNLVRSYSFPSPGQRSRPSSVSVG
jgi:hypothetical protein